MPDNITAEIEWEHAAVERGVRRYRESLLRQRKDGSFERRELTELEPGQEIMRDVVSASHEAIAAAAEEAHNAYATKGRGREERWWFPILCLEPDKLAVIAARALLSANASSRRALRSVALEIGRNVQVQREFELWKKQQTSAATEARKAGQYVPDFWRFMRELSPEQDERAFLKWAKKSEQYQKLDWPREMRLHLGIKLVYLVVEACPKWFELTLPGTVSHGRYRTERLVCLTELARQWITLRHEYNEMRRPWLVPMISEPIDWVRTTREKKDEAEGMGDPQDDGGA